MKEQADAPLAVTIGNFDGVHLGHRAILERLKAHARASGATPAVVTFDPHPQAVLRGHAPLALATAPRRRSEEHTSELQSQSNLVCRLLLEKKKNTTQLYQYLLPVNRARPHTAQTDILRST